MFYKPFTDRVFKEGEHEIVVIRASGGRTTIRGEVVPGGMKFRVGGYVTHASVVELILDGYRRA
ncbi:hypothetical protein [Sulfitobacter sp. 1A15106]|uniref:hypothetical protein n=1 Tax=Sulfitobacter sp. 1A15106 TaxID=3368590 RepID=UPI0037454B6A